MYKEGIGVKQNNTEAVKWLKKAANQNDTESQMVLGNMYYNGDGVKENKTEAIKWYQKAAENNNSRAQAIVGVCLYGRNRSKIKFCHCQKMVW